MSAVEGSSKFVPAPGCVFMRREPFDSGISKSTRSHMKVGFTRIGVYRRGALILSPLTNSLCTFFHVAIEAREGGAGREEAEDALRRGVRALREYSGC